jgi:hypothetical protein
MSNSFICNVARVMQADPATGAGAKKLPFRISTVLTPPSSSFVLAPPFADPLQGHPYVLLSAGT